MIQKLVQALADQLRATFKEAAEFAQPDQQIQAGLLAVSDNEILPFIGLSSGKLLFSQKTRESKAGVARSQEFSEQLNAQAATQTYALKHAPLPGSLRCKLVSNAGQPTEQVKNCQEPKDFTVDYDQATLNFQPVPPTGSLLLLTYSFSGIFALREFSQELFIDILAANPEVAEQWASLVLAVILTDETILLEQANSTQGFGVGSVKANSTLAQIWLVSSQPDFSNSVAKIRLHLQVEGYLKFSKELTDKPELIQKVTTIPILSSNQD